MHNEGWGEVNVGKYDDIWLCRSVRYRFWGSYDSADEFRGGFAAMIGSGFNPWICVVTASVGNWLGGMTNYYLRYLGKIEWLEKYLKN